MLETRLPIRRGEKQALIRILKREGGKTKRKYAERHLQGFDGELQPQHRQDHEKGCGTVCQGQNLTDYFNQQGENNLRRRSNGRNYVHVFKKGKL